jgi:hypothetical protein
VKFSNPMIFAGSGEISRALVKASAKHSPTGTKKNTISSSTAGLTMSAPVNPSRPRRARFLVAGVSVRRPPFGGSSWVTAMTLSKGGQAALGAGEHPARTQRPPRTQAP